MHGTRSPRPTAVFKTSSLTLLLIVFAHNVFASGAGEHSALPAPPAGANSLKPIVHVRSAAPDFRPEPPTGVRIPERYLDYDHSPETSSARFIDDEPSKAMHFARIAGKSLVTATTTCDANAFANASTSTIGELVRTSDLSCINTLFNLTGTTAASAFSESKMIAVANYAKPYAVSYPGDNSTGVQQFALFLRVGYYVQFYDSTDIPAYSSNVTTAVDTYLDAFVANPHFYDVNDNHGEVLNEVLTLTASSGQQARYAGTYKNLLNRYDRSYNAFYYMKGSIDQVLAAFFHGAWVPAWVSLVNSDTSVVSTLNNFVTRTSFNANAPDEWLTRDAAAELAHFLDGSTYASNVVNVAKPLVRTVIQTYNFTNNGVSIFIAAVAGQDYYDGANCSYYGTCSTKSQVMAAVQGQSYQCPGDAIKVVAQNMTTQQFSDACATLHNEVAYIHGLFKDPGPVAGDNTVGLEVDVFNTSADYATYGSYLYGISTNNGGLSIEGDPSQVGNVAHFYCYHAEWITADWEIWNLWHEFTHYMDAKYNQKGAFADAPTSNANLPYSEVWWIEGIAEYVSYSYRNLVDSGAVTVAGNHTYSLPRLFNNTYDMASYQEAAYPGGYLAVNFMINNHRADIDTVLGIFRAGGYSTNYHTFLDGIRNSYTSQFEAFETCFKNNSGTGGCTGTTASLSPTSLTFGSTTVGSTSAAQSASLKNIGPSSTTISTIAVSGDYAQTNNCGTLASGSSCTISVTFKPTTTGTRTGTLTVTDSASNSPQTASLTGTGASSGGNVLANGVGVTIADAAINHQQNWTMVVPAGATNLVFSISGGTGDADLYVKFGSAPTLTSYDCRPYLVGNNETCTISNVQAGTYYVMVNAYAAYSGATLKGSYSAGSGTTASLSSTSLTFGSTNVGSTSAAQNVTLSNTGSSALSISSVAISGDYAQSNNCGTSLASGSSCAISLTFKPTASGTRTGTLTVTDNATNSPQTASLTGTGATAGNISYSGTIAAQGGYAFTSNFTSGAGTVTATLNIPAGTSWRFVADDATANQAITERDGTGLLTITFTAVAGHSYNFFVQATAGSGAWSITGSHP
jgi:microbial collagenase